MLLTDSFLSMLHGHLGSSDSGPGLGLSTQRALVLDLREAHEMRQILRSQVLGVAVESLSKRQSECT